MIAYDNVDYKFFSFDIENRHGAQTEGRAPSERSTDHPGVWIFNLNVCGLRSKIETSDFTERCKKYELVFFSETKTDDRYTGDARKM